MVGVLFPSIVIKKDFILKIRKIILCFVDPSIAAGILQLDAFFPA